MTVKPATEEDVAELTGRSVARQPAAARRPLQRGDNPVVDAAADALTQLIQQYGSKAVDWVVETGAPKAWAWGKGVVADWKARQAGGAAAPARAEEAEPVVVDAEPMNVEEVGITAAIEADKPVMRWSEAEQRVRRAREHQELRDQEISLVLGSRIVADDDPAVLGSAAVASSAGQLDGGLPRMLEASSHLADGDVRYLDDICVRDAGPGNGMPARRV